MKSNTEHLNLSASSQTNSGSEKFQTANLARCIYTLVMVLVFYHFQLPWIVVIGSVHLVFSVIWFLLIHFDILVEKDVWWSGYVPATFDLIWLTVLAYGTGHITSFFILGYLGSIALSSMSLDRNYGVYNAFLATVLFSAMGFFVYYDVIPLVNILMPPVKPTLLSIFISSLLLGGSAFIVNQIVSKLFSSLTDVNEKLLAIAMTDPLTGISNRRSFFSNLEIEMARQHRSTSPYPIAFLLFDLDLFKSINDTYGHEIGDLVLVEFASVLKTSLRKQDFPARWGGEEFLVLLPNTDLDGAIVTAEKIRRTFNSLKIPIKGKELQCSTSVGISILRDQTTNPESIINLADEYLYEAKRKGRNQVYSEKNL
ncbi:GGDEF domain-containing protein [Leptospira limi]|uniref:diguanylate cyclase n=1 Tax=Leptospira limi TaxID=2950023 RepID=A0ABT3LWR3_9LEPT|nr:GGDEF domain-containing protein [Leptospira limi]MCW7462165.1 GGDEF domain-containing protein [Leptospira limi]